MVEARRRRSRASPDLRRFVVDQESAQKRGGAPLRVQDRPVELPRWGRPSSARGGAPPRLAPFPELAPMGPLSVCARQHRGALTTLGAEGCSVAARSRKPRLPSASGWGRVGVHETLPTGGPGIAPWCNQR